MSDRSPLVEFFVLAGGVAAIVLVIYLALGWMVEIMAPHVPYELELRIAESIPFQTWEGKASEEQRIVQALAEELAAKSEWAPRELHVHIVGSDEANAAALPAGHILVFRGLLREVESENELAMILGHEIGHLVHRDHLKSLGRSLVLQSLSWILFGNAPGVSNLADLELQSIDRRFDRQNESRCDDVGLSLLVQHYGHAGGATDFFERHLSSDGPQQLAWLRSHPLSAARVEDLARTIENQGFALGDTRPYSGIPE